MESNNTSSSTTVTQGTVNGNVNPENAILVSRNCIQALRSALKQNANPLDKLASDRECLDFVVSEMAPIFKDCPVYYTGNKGENPYHYKGSECTKKLQATELRDKGRFVEACVIGYLYGREGLAKWCTSGRVIRPRHMSEQEKQAIQTHVAGIAPAKDVESSFIPGTAKDNETP